MKLRPLRATLASEVLILGLFVVLQLLVVLAIFGWEIGEIVLGSLIGGVVWGSLAWFSETRPGVPVAGDQVPDAPSGAAIEDERDGPALWRLGILPLAALAMAWIASASGTATLFVPGMSFGYFASTVAGLVLVRHWERSAGRTLFTSSEHRKATLYAR